MELSIRCSAAPWENETTEDVRAIDIAYDLCQEYQCQVQLVYPETGMIFSILEFDETAVRSIG
jgi:hypothetical protein